LEEAEEEKEKTPKEIIRETKIEIFRKVYANIQIKLEKLTQIFGVTLQTGYNWLDNKKE